MKKQLDKEAINFFVDSSYISEIEVAGYGSALYIDNKEVTIKRIVEDKQKYGEFCRIIIRYINDYW